MTLPPSSNAAEQLVLRGAVAEAYHLLEEAIAAGDAMAAATLADWRLAGDVIRRDLAAARDLYGRAAELGMTDAAPIHIAMLANGAGGSGRDWPAALSSLRRLAVKDGLARKQIALLDRMWLSDAGDPAALPKAQLLCEAPHIAQLDAFLTPDECRYLVDLALPALQPAVVVHPQTGAFVQDPVRSALSAAFPFVREDPVLHAINRRIAAATASRYEQGEPLQVLSYQGGQEYRLHSDTLPLGQNQRVATFLVTLSADFDGGATSFPRANIAWRGKLGDALHFRNVDAGGQPDATAWHSGEPVLRGRKFILSKWIRASPLDLAGPPGRQF